MAKVHADMNGAGTPRDRQYANEKDEVLRASDGMTMKERDSDASITMHDKMVYYTENFMSVYTSAQFWGLGIITLMLTVVLGLLWKAVAPPPGGGGGDDDGDDGDDPFGGTRSLADAIYTSFEVIVAGGYNSDIQDPLHRLVFLAMLFCGLVIFGIFVGFITDAVTGFMEALSEGKTKVVEEGHTLILGWNESTPRLVCQIAFLRRAWRVPNETWARTLCPWLRVPPSTPVAKAPIVLLNERHEKAEMEEILGAALAARGVSPKRTKMGWDVVCRHGDPTDVHMLVRAGAQNARSIVLMLTEQDACEVEASGGMIQNGGTIAGMLALRHVLYSGDRPMDPDLRVSVQLSEPSRYCESAGITSQAGEPIVQFRDLSALLNSLMFSCAVTPGLSKVLLELINFEGPALRARDAPQLRGGPDGAVGGLVGLTMRAASAMWLDGILVGVGDAVVTAGAGGGFAGDPERVIRASDRLLFVSSGSHPHALDSATRASYEQRAAKLVEEAATPANTAKRLLYGASGLGRSGDVDAPKREVAILVCGWRAKWNSSTTALRARVDDLAQQLTPGPARIIFLNLVDSEAFANLMDNCGFVQRGSQDAEAAWEFGPSRPGVAIEHVCGDAASPVDLEPVLEGAPSIEAIIVLGTSASQSLPPHSCDLRVLSILLLLRHLHSDTAEAGDKTYRAKPVHIIGENQEDMTSVLALPPRPAKGQEAGHDPDFVNTQAIVARALCQSVAFPKMTASVEDLFSDEPGSSYIHIVPIELFGLAPPTGALPFGVVLNLVLQSSGGRDKCIGIARRKGSQILGPSLDEEHAFEGGDRLILLTRRTKIEMAGGDAVTGSDGAGLHAQALPSPPLSAAVVVPVEC